MSSACVPAPAWNIEDYGHVLESVWDDGLTIWDGGATRWDVVTVNPWEQDCSG